MAGKVALGRLSEAILETATYMRRLGIMNDTTHEKIALRHLGGKPAPAAEPITAEEVRSLRERAHLSQAVFARYLNVTPGLCLPARARHEAADRPGARAAERHQAPRDRGHLLSAVM